ncbi:hypothetical protein ACFLXA_01185 [Chloroflexota bacterium]
MTLRIGIIVLFLSFRALTRNPEALGLVPRQTGDKPWSYTLSLEWFEIIHSRFYEI